MAAPDQRSRQPDGFLRLGTLSAEGFSLVEGASLEGHAWVANRRDCRIDITTLSPLGWHQSAIADRAGGQELVYIYAGQVYERQPVILTKLDYYWHKLANYFHSSSQPPVFGVVTSPGCASQSVDPIFIAQHLL
ncbi:MAG: hypothetical protein KJ944_07455 [Alphaproteobacteria bacterium]|nr:hypothetical protein [Alphaproteobacteria bacterium]MBU1561599.1 hypothetical protein [Alphaproteobacteria bacterium]MBU2302420.1 hypothetical protein [Alphaproteobacteria bacterium]MBU2368700.1 hypothetical protein [Alphaproteobacteria bacterium]